MALSCSLLGEYSEPGSSTSPARARERSSGHHSYLQKYQRRTSSPEDRLSMAAKADSRLPHCLCVQYAYPGPSVQESLGRGALPQAASCCPICEHSCFGTGVARWGSLVSLSSASQPGSSQNPAPKSRWKSYPRGI